MKKRILTMALAIVLLFALIPAGAEAATTAPACVKTKATQLMRESGMDVAFVVKLGADRKGTGYMFYRNSRGKVVCDRSGAVILGKNTPYKKSYTYHLYRNFNFEYNNKVMKWKIGRTQYEQAWPINIECDQVAEYSFLVHGYVRYKEPGRAWKACKSASKNTNGLTMCERFARYLRSCADDGCPVAFM